MTRSRQELILICIALAFSSIGSLSLTLQTRDPFPLASTLLLGGMGFTIHFWLNRYAPQRDLLLLPVAFLLMSWGILILHRVAQNFVTRQLVWVAIGLFALALITATRDRLRWLRRFKYTWLLAGLALLSATLVFGLNPSGEGARLWLGVVGIYVQPSEILRLLLIAFLAAFFTERVVIFTWLISPNTLTRGSTVQATKKTIHSVASRLIPYAPSIVMWLIGLALLISQQDMGAAMLLLLTYIFMVYLVTGQSSLALFGLFMLILAVVIGYFVSARIALRVNIWLNPWIDPQGTSYQIVQSLIAITSGGVFGQGIGQGSPGYVPAVHTDFPFAAIGEESGLLGIIGVLLLYAVLCLRAWRIAHDSKSAYGLLLAGGIAALFTTQLFVIVGGNLGLIPLTGVTLPFVSYGGSSLLVSLIAVGLLLRISADQKPIVNHPEQTHFTSELLDPITIDGIARPTANQRQAARRAMVFSAILIISLAFISGYWSVLQMNQIVGRDDNPRKHDAERAIYRGSILARDGASLVISKPDIRNEVGSPQQFTRVYMQPASASVVGFYSNRYGTTGLEQYGDSFLRGSRDLLGVLLHQTQLGSQLRTSIDITQQVSLAGALEGSKGAGIVMDWKTGEILALSSAPTYDPNTIDVDWERLISDTNAPLLNRATQGLYQPGSLLKWINQSGEASHSNAEDQWDTTDRYSLGKVVPFELESAFVPYPATVTYSETIGQGTLRISPLRLSALASSLAAGRMVTPTLLPVRDARALQATPKIKVDQIFLAQSSSNSYVGWYLRITETTVTVLAVEMPSASTAPLLLIRDRLIASYPSSR